MDPVIREPPSSKHRIKVLLNGLSRGFRALILASFAAWGALAIYHSNAPGWLRPPLAVGYLAATLCALLLVRSRRRANLTFFSLFGGVCCWWLLIPPSNNRDWLPDAASLSTATIDGEKVTIRGIRDFDYRSETDFTIRYRDREFQLSKLRTADLFLCYWGSPAIAHPMISFGFGEDDYLCISIETRKEKGETYSAIRGFFKQYELIYVIGEERDLVRLRTNCRGEDVYLYRLVTRPEIIRKVFLAYLAQVNRLAERPEWYNALTTNCTTSIRGHTEPYAHATGWSWKLLLTGYVDELAYEAAALDRSLPFDELKRRCRITERAMMLGDVADFSRRIREGVPAPTDRADAKPGRP